MRMSLPGGSSKVFKVLGAPLQDVERLEAVHFQESDDDARKGGARGVPVFDHLPFLLASPSWRL